MEVALTKELEELIAEQVDKGNYPSANEVVRDALRLLKARSEERERRLAALEREVRVGVEALEGGEYVEYEATELGLLAAGIKKRGRDRLAKSGPTE